jgi:hypothetical protein
MAKINKNSYRLDADYTEDTVGFAIESFLTLISFPIQRFSVEPFSKVRERNLGADVRLRGRISGFRPFYMQFKRPSAYPDYSTSKIIVDRKKLKLTASPNSLYFSLREKQPSQTVYQQNVLLRLRNHLLNRKLGDAAYVCPLFLDRSSYRFHLHLAGLSRWPRFWLHSPWDLEEVLVDTSGRTIRFDRIPVLNEHVTIPPHDTVTSARHSYSFTDRGAEVCFHSPQTVPDGASSLAIFLKRLSQDFLSGGERITRENANPALQTLITATADDAIPPELRDIRDDRDAIEKWLLWGQHLQHEYGIEQFALTSWED